MENANNTLSSTEPLPPYGPLPATCAVDYTSVLGELGVDAVDGAVDDYAVDEDHELMQVVSTYTPSPQEQEEEANNNLKFGENENSNSSRQRTDKRGQRIRMNAADKRNGTSRNISRQPIQFEGDSRSTRSQAKRLRNDDDDDAAIDADDHHEPALKKAKTVVEEDSTNIFVLYEENENENNSSSPSPSSSSSSSPKISVSLGFQNQNTYYFYDSDGSFEENYNLTSTRKLDIRSIRQKFTGIILKILNESSRRKNPQINKANAIHLEQKLFSQNTETSTIAEYRDLSTLRERLLAIIGHHDMRIKEAEYEITKGRVEKRLVLLDHAEHCQCPPKMCLVVPEFCQFMKDLVAHMGNCDCADNICPESHCSSTKRVLAFLNEQPATNKLVVWYRNFRSFPQMKRNSICQEIVGTTPKPVTKALIAQIKKTANDDIDSKNLQEIAKAIGVSAAGTKEAIIERITGACTPKQAIPQAPPPLPAADQAAADQAAADPPSPPPPQPGTKLEKSIFSGLIGENIGEIIGQVCVDHKIVF